MIQSLRIYRREYNKKGSNIGYARKEKNVQGIQYKHGRNYESVENQRIFPRYSLVYLLPFLYIIILPFTLYLVSFFVPLFCIYIGVSIPCNSLIQ